MQGAAAVNPPVCSIKFLGGFSVAIGGRPVDVEARKNRGLIGILAMSPGMLASRDRLAGLLWSDRGEEQARASLRQSLALLRKDLDSENGSVILVRDDEIGLDRARVAIDVVDFLKLAKAQAVEDLRAAAALYGGDFMAETGIRDQAFEEWLAMEQQRFRRDIITVLDRLVGLEAGSSAVEVAQRLVQLDPLREASQRHLMQALSNSGETAQALKVFEACKALLKSELGVEPSQQTLALRDLIRAGQTMAPTAMPVPTARAGTRKDRPVIAVLPLVNLSGSQEQDFFSDGITEDIITELSRFRNMGVIARNSSFAYRGRNAGIDEIGRELGASYVLDGSVRREGGRVRITARLANVASGSQVWAERFDRDLSDIFNLQDELARRIAGTLAIELDDRELERAKGRLDDERAYDHFLRGKRLSWKQGEATLEARRHFESAIRIDPGLARAHAALAMTYIHEALQFPPRARFDEALAAAQDCAEAALSLDPSESFGHMALAWVYLYRRDYERARRHTDLAIKLNPNDADTLANCNYVLTMDGDFDAAIAAGKLAMELNPRYPEWYASLLSASLFNAGRYAESMEYRRRAPATFYDSIFTGAATLAYLGELTEAKEWGRRAVSKLADRLGEAAVAEQGPISLLLANNPYRHAAHAEHFVEGMRRAGVPG